MPNAWRMDRTRGIPDDMDLCKTLAADICYENPLKAIDKNLVFEYPIKQK